MKQIRPREVLIAGRDPEDYPNQIYPTSGVRLMPDDRFPGVVMESLLADWYFVAYELRPGEPSGHPHEDTYRMVYKDSIDETHRVHAIRRARENQDI